VLPKGDGQVWVVDAYRCSASALRDAVRLRRLMARIVRSLGLHPVGRPKFFRFPGSGGVTALWMLKESHLACHTFPEFESACFDLFCCHPVARWSWEKGLASSISARRVRVRCFKRRYGRRA
jgi:S-adenosylmethionine decarboxylase